MLSGKRSFFVLSLLILALAGLAYISTNADAQGQKTKKKSKDTTVFHTGNSPVVTANPAFVYACASGPQANSQVTLQAAGTSSSYRYIWSRVNGQTIPGNGTTTTWDLSGLPPGTYEAQVEVDTGSKTASCVGTTTVRVLPCPPTPIICPSVSVDCPTSAQAGAPVTFNASVGGGAANLAPTYNWSVSAGTISSGQGTSSITVDTTNLGGQTVTATVELGGVDASCTRSASCSTPIKPPPATECGRFDTYNDIKFDDEKARLDNFAIQLQNTPGAQGYIIAYGSCTDEGRRRAERAKSYMVTMRGIDAGRIVIIDGGCRSELLVELYVCQPGAIPPTADMSRAVTPCPDCRRKTPKPRPHHQPRRRVRGGSGEEEE